MADERLWDAVATIIVDGKKAGPYRLGVHGRITIGRSGRAGLKSPSPRIQVPRELARLRCTKNGWMLENEGGTVGSEPRPVRVIGPIIESPNGALFAPGAFVLLSEGTCTLKWDVGVIVTVLLEPAGPGSELLDEAIDQPHRQVGMGTLSVEPVTLNDLQRRNMAALFAYAIRREPQPREPYAEAARLLGGAPSTVEKNRKLIKAQLPKIAQKINKGRAVENRLTTLDEIGFYLVKVTGTLDEDDLDY